MSYGMDGWNKPSGDSISRTAAIDALSRCQTYLFDTRDTDRKISLEDAEYVIEKLPSAQPERKKGRWIPHEDEDGEHYGDKCSECGDWYVMPYGKTKYCPNCGADMREVSEWQY